MSSKCMRSTDLAQCLYEPLTDLSVHLPLSREDVDCCLTSEIRQYSISACITISVVGNQYAKL
jgi:hypothetical protein